MIYDYIVLGGGISGLYCAYLLLKRSPKASILILEKEGSVGGRIHTYVDKYMEVEAGAGRFNRKHNILLDLIGELGLAKKIVPISNDIGYAPADGSEPKILFGKDILSRNYIARVITASKKTSDSVLKNTSFIDFCKKVLQPNEIEYIKASFGYYSELVIMNALDAIHLMGELTPDNEFLVLNGGLSQIINRLEKSIIRRASSRILCNKTVVDIRIEDNKDGAFGAGSGEARIIEVYCNENKRPYRGTKCICALPKQVSENLVIFRMIRPLFSQIVCGSLCRIYSKFPLVNGKVWFSGLSKFTTNNNLRMVIPISEADGVIMISYSDNKYADGWNRLYKSGGIREVNRELAILMKKSTGIDIPAPISTRVFHWTCGVGYWGIGANSSQFPLQPDIDIPIYLCGEHYSATHQQWVEGALETAEIVIASI